MDGWKRTYYRDQSILAISRLVIEILVCEVDTARVGKIWSVGVVVLELYGLASACGSWSVECRVRSRGLCIEPKPIRGNCGDSDLVLQCV